MPDATYTSTVLRKALVFVTVEVLVLAAILFGSARTLYWAEAWVFLAIFGIGIWATTIVIGRKTPELLDERMRVMAGDQPVWDKLAMVAFGICVLLWLVLPGLEIMGGAPSAWPAWVKGLGALGAAGAFWALAVTMSQNAYLATSVRHQSDRDQKVVTDGAYAIIRHPFYATLILFFLFGAVLLGHWSAVLASLGMALCLALRIVGEEALLVRHLDGYVAYQNVTRYRLIPGIW